MLIPSRARLFRPSLFAWLFIVGLFGAGMATCAQAQPQAVEVDCSELAGFAAMMTTYREVGASIEKVRAVLRQANAQADPDVLRVFEAELARVWREGLAREDAAAAALKRCIEVLGQYPRTRDG